MLPTLAETVQDFALSLLDPDRAVPAQLAGEPQRIRSAFQVYRANYRVTLVDTLRSSFPVTATLVGDEFFVAMASGFVRLHPPRSPVLIEYGKEFPEYIDAFGPAAAVPYLGDVSRLEWAWLEAYHAPEGIPAGVRDLIGLPPSKIAAATVLLHPSARLVRSSYPIASIWAAHQSRQGEAPLGRADESALISRPAAEVQVFSLAGPHASFIAALFAGSTIEESATAAIHVQQDFDAGTALLHLLECGAIAALRP